MGELLDADGGQPPPGLAFVKWGLAGFASSAAWHDQLEARRSIGPSVVAVAYADWQCARAPSVDAVLAFAAQGPDSVLLIDTHCKDAGRRGSSRPTLLDWLPPADVMELCTRAHASSVRIALAG
jgi:uncharacterized protein (UPF0264 family)